MATLNAIRYNQRIRKFYESLLRRGKAKKLALIAAIRKLSLIAHAVHKSKEHFKVEFRGLIFITVSELAK